MTDDDSFTASQPGLGSWLAKLFSGGDNPAESRDEILRFVSECHARGLLHADEFRMLQGVLKVSEMHVRDIMVPRAHMVVLQKDDSPEDLLKTIVDSGHSRFPVIASDKDEVVVKSARNIPSVTVLPTVGVNVLDILKRRHIVMTKAAAAALTQRLAG